MSGIEIKRILLPIDGTDASLNAARYAIRLARSEGAEVICLNIIGAPNYHPSRHPASAQTVLTYYTLSRRLAKIWFAKIKEMAAENNVSVRTKILVDMSGSTADAVTSCADSENADFIVIGIRKMSTWQKFVNRSLIDDVVNRARCPVLIIRQD